MAIRLFALIIGIDSYKSGDIWDLNSCVEDAKRINDFFIDELKVPQNNIRLLLNQEATKKGIEEKFMKHLVSNPAITKGDAIVIYFAGHGSVMRAPEGWFDDIGTSVDNVEVLCPYDHDQKDDRGRVAGISDRSMRALIGNLAQAKGDNITLITDCCFSPIQSHINILDRGITRWTRTIKAKPDDLYTSLWEGARKQQHTRGLGFYTAHPQSHIFLAACSPGEKAVEERGRGRFTRSLLDAAAELSFHCTSYLSLFDHILRKMAVRDQTPVCLGTHTSRIIFDAVPFSTDSKYVPARLDDRKQLRIEIGTMLGIVEGSEFSLHLHNYRASRNPAIATVVTSEVHTTWCIGQVTTSAQPLPAFCWAQITHWNSPFSIHLKAPFTSLFRKWKLRRTISTRSPRSKVKGSFNVTWMQNLDGADISITVKRREVVVERHDDTLPVSVRQSVKTRARDPLDVINDAARFFLHLNRRNPEKPLDGLVNIELSHLDATSGSRTGGNLIKDGKAIITHTQGATFTAVIHNSSDVDLWPYLFYMDPDSFGVTKLYDPQLSSQVPPLPRHSQLQIGHGQPGSQALSFSSEAGANPNLGFLKLFLAPAPVTLDTKDQSHHPGSSQSLEQVFVTSTRDQMWDSISIPIQFTQP